MCLVAVLTSQHKEPAPQLSAAECPGLQSSSELTLQCKGREVGEAHYIQPTASAASKTQFKCKALGRQAPEQAEQQQTERQQ